MTEIPAAVAAELARLRAENARLLKMLELRTRPRPEVHDYLDERTGVLAAMLAKRAPGYAGLGFSDPRKLALTPSASTDNYRD